MDAPGHPRTLTMADRDPPAHGDIDMDAVRQYRLARVRRGLAERDIAAAVLMDPLNIRYATDSTNMQVWVMHNPARYAFVPAEGPVVLFDFHNCAFLSDGLGTVDEVRPAISTNYFLAGPRFEERAARWAAELADLLRAHGGGNRRLGLDCASPLCAYALDREGIEVVDAGQVLEHARALKSPGEVACMRASIAAADEGMRRMREALAPGITENALWSLLHQANIEMGGEWIETRLLASGTKTNPWFQECGFRVIRDGDLVSFDTDLIGPFGYCADISRTFLCGDGHASDEQRRLYATAREQIETNLTRLRPGISLHEFGQVAYDLAPEFRRNRYSVVAHGVGLCDEYPHVPYPEDYGHGGYDGVIVPGMTLCVESYVGAEGGAEGVKLEQQVLMTDNGPELLSHFPFEDKLA